jgi:hypothetical protein
MCILIVKVYIFAYSLKHLYMNRFSFILLCIAPIVSYAQYPNISAKERAIVETMTSTFNFQGDTLGGGTCFLVKKNSRQYFVTAAHLFRTANKSGDIVPITMVIQSKPKYVEAKVYFHQKRNIDVAVMILPERIEQQGGGISIDSTFVMFGTQVLFYGFPLTNLGTDFPEIKLPLVKGAIVSGIIKYDNADMIVLDGHNNKGFSGGPAVAYDTSMKKMCVIGVISGFLRESRNTQYKGESLPFDENSGIILCYYRDYIEEVIKNIK